MPDQPTEPPQPPGSPPDSVRLLQQILNRLHKMEGGLTEHEQWLRRIEQEHQQAPSPAASGMPEAMSTPAGAPQTGEDDLRRLIGALTLERDRAIRHLADAERQVGQYQTELTALRNQAAELQKLTAERERQLTALKAASTTQLGEARSVHADVNRQLQERQQQVQAMQARVQAVEQQAQDKDRRIAELQSSLNQAAAQIEEQAVATKGTAATTSEGTAWPRFARLAVAVLVLAGLASAGLTAWLYEHARADAVVSAASSILLPGADAGTVQQCAALAARNSDINVTSDPALGRIEITAIGANGPAVLQRADDVARAVAAARLASLATPPMSPATQPEGQRLTARIRESQQQLGAMSRPAGPGGAGPDVNTDELVAQHKALQAERRKLLDAQAELARRIETQASVRTPADVTADQIAKAEAANPQLQTELEALKQREDQLAGRLRVSVDAAAVQFKSLRQLLGTQDGEFEKLLNENQSEDVKAQLTAARESLKTWNRALAELDTQWQAQRKALQSFGTADALAIQAVLTRSAQAFLAETTTASIALAKALQSIGQGQDQTTKRLVLRNALVKQLGPVTTAQDAAVAAARSAVLTDNPELTAIVQRLDALRRQIQQRRTDIVEALRRDRVHRVQQDHATSLTLARQEQTKLAQRLAEIDAAVLRLGDRGTQAAAALAQQTGALAAATSVQAREIQDLHEFVKLHEQFAAQVASTPPTTKPICTPARLLAGSAGPSLPATLLIGAAPVLGSAIVLLIASLVIASRRSQQTIEDYARSLKDMARSADA